MTGEENWRMHTEVHLRVKVQSSFCIPSQRNYSLYEMLVQLTRISFFVVIQQVVQKTVQWTENTWVF